MRNDTQRYSDVCGVRKEMNGISCLSQGKGEVRLKEKGSEWEDVRLRINQMEETLNAGKWAFTGSRLFNTPLRHEPVR